MKINLFTISEGAFNKNGSLTIVNTIDTIVVGSYPSKVPIAFALKISTNEDDSGERKLAIVTKHLEKDRELSRIETVLKVPETEGNYSFAANINGFAIPEVGTYSFAVYFDDKLASEVMIKAKTNG